MGSNAAHVHLTRRERQILDIVFESGEATAAQIQDKLPDPPSNATVRKLLTLLEDKGHLRHRQDGPRYVYSPTVTPGKARKSALKHVMNTFFSGSPESLMVALLDMESGNLSNDQISKIRTLIDEAKEEGR